MNQSQPEKAERGIEEIMRECDVLFDGIELAKSWFRKQITGIHQSHHQELQKAREEERERIEAIFKEHVPPHAMDLEDSVWLKRLLNKAFGHENIY